MSRILAREEKEVTLGSKWEVESSSWVWILWEVVRSIRIMKVNTISFDSGIKVEEIDSLIVEIYKVIEESSKDVWDRIESMICTKRDLEVQMSKGALFVDCD